VFNVAKLKSHRLAGITGCMKNLVGINGHKSFLPHFRQGPATNGHDEYPTKNALKALQSTFAELHDATSSRWAQLPYGLMRYSLLLLLKPFHREFDSGHGTGNDTIWRTILDLNRNIVVRRQGRLDSVVSVPKGFLSGGCNPGRRARGPMRPKDKHCGAILAGTNALVVDSVAARFMGLPWN